MGDHQEKKPREIGGEIVNSQREKSAHVWWAMTSPSSKTNS